MTANARVTETRLLSPILRPSSSTQQLPYASMEPAPPLQSTTSTLRPPRHRGAVACRRCRRLRNKCLNNGARPPCSGCIAAGPDTAASCVFPVRGQRDVDREFRRRPYQSRLSEDGQPQSQPQPQPQPGPSPELQLEPQPQPPPQSRTARDSSLFSSDNAACNSSQHATRSSSSSAASPPSIIIQSPRRLPPPSANAPAEWPPHREVVDGCQTFVTCYFQLGFLHKTLFLELLAQSPGETSRFMLSCILAISSRFTPALVLRYGSRAAATDYFLGLAQAQASTEMYSPSLERTQAFFLLSIAEWGNSDRERSAIDMAVAARMAILLQLHREETYRLPTASSPAAVAPAGGPDWAQSPCSSFSGVSADHVVRLESARRTLWMIYSQENLHSGTLTPAPLALGDTTALLPCGEADFAFGVVPSIRAALTGTPPAREHPALAVLPGRCLFATLIQAHSLWGRVARHATRESLGDRPPWSRESAFASITDTLQRWEATLPPRHRWSLWNLRGWRSEGLHLAYLSVVMVLRLSNIVIRRVYLNKLIIALSPRDTIGTPVFLSQQQQQQHEHPTDQDNLEDADSNHTSSDRSQARPSRENDSERWQRMSHELFDNVVELHEQVVAYFSIRTPGEGFPAILVFCIYMCGSLASYLWHNPHLCPHISPVEAEEMVLGTLRILGELYTAWPASARWQEVLRRIAGADDLQQILLSQGQQQQEQNNTAASLTACTLGEETFAVINTDSARSGRRASTGSPAPCSVDTSLAHDDSREGSVRRSNGNGNGSGKKAADFINTNLTLDCDARPLIAAFPDDLFNAELTDYLDGNIHYGLLDRLA